MPLQAKSSPSASDTVNNLLLFSFPLSLLIALSSEFSGTITSLGPSLQGDWKVGDRVVVEPVISCHSCYACQHGYNNACTSLGFVGLSGYGGGLSEYVALGEEYLHKLPEGVSRQFWLWRSVLLSSIDLSFPLLYLGYDSSSWSDGRTPRCGYACSRTKWDEEG